MTIDDLLNMAAESAKDLTLDGWGVMFSKEQLMRFASLVAATEREACAKVCEELLSAVSTGDEHMDGVCDCIAAIRARGQG